MDKTDDANKFNWMIAMKNKLLSEESLNVAESFAQRKTGEVFPFQSHIKAMLYSLLSSQIDWGRVQPLLPQIDEAFHYYDVSWLKNTESEKLAVIINDFGLKASIDRKKQMQGFIYNISIMENIDRIYEGGLDKFVKQNTINVISELSGRTVKNINGKVEYKPGQTFLKNIKLKQMDVALVCEYLKNVGIQTIKPDTHVNRFYKRFYGMDALEYKPYIQDGEHRAFFRDVFNFAEQDSARFGISVGEIDAIIWPYCANSTAKICSKRSPKCNICVVESLCKKDFR